ncbi:MAG: UvrD-helicase domain-containing protein, partial [Myxococcota bacterium]
QRIRNDFETTLVVEAAAGTGKTTELVARIVGAVARGLATLEAIVAVTFTEKAAGELKVRLLEALKVAAAEAEGETQARLQRAQRTIDLAPIGTIHSFCTEILREYPAQAGLDPLFEVLDEAGAEQLQREAFRRWFERILSAPPRSVERVLRGSHYYGPREELWRAAREIIARRDFPAPWPRPKGDYAELMGPLIDQVEALGKHAAQGERRDPLTGYLEEFHDLAKNLRAQERVAAGDDPLANQDLVEGMLREFARSGPRWNNRGFAKGSFGALSADDVRAKRDALRKDFDLWLARADAHLASTLKDALQDVRLEYERLKRQSGVVDFFDLLLDAERLLQDQSVRAELLQRYRFVLVDEFQDTDPRQTNVLRSLCSDDEGALIAGRLFVVGDPKQAIYRFRRADIGVYDRAKTALLEAGAECLQLNTSFRAQPAIQRVLNATFAECFGRGEPEDRGLRPAHVPLAPFVTERIDQPSVVALPLANPWNKWGSRFSPRNGATETVAAFVQWLIESRWTHGRERRPFRAEDVCLIMPRMQSGATDLAAAYAGALERRGLDTVFVAGRAFHERSEVLALRAACGAIEWPEDTLRVYATLRGPLYGFSDDALHVWMGARPLDPMAKPEGDSPIALALRDLAEFHVLRNHRSAEETVLALLERVRASALLAIAGHASQDHVARFVELARRHDRNEPKSFRAFVETLDSSAEDGARRENAAVEAGQGGVRLATVHGAKGLEFPCVVLCEIDAPRRPFRASHFVDLDTGLWAGRLAGAESQPLLEHRKRVLAEEAAESDRKLYVAATRAKDLLVMPAIGDFVEERHQLNYWTEALLRTMTPQEPAARARPASAAGCPPFGERSVLRRPKKALAMEGLDVKPGRHGDIVWWDPAILPAAPPLARGVPQPDRLRGEGAAKSRERFEAFESKQRARIEAGSRASERRRTATEASRIEAPSDRPVTVVFTGASEGRSSRGARFGTLVHAALADVVGGAHAGAAIAAHGRALGATQNELDDAVQAVDAARAHPVLQRALSAERCAAEVHLVHRQVDGALLEGSADLVFFESDPFGEARWVVVDFKSDLHEAVPDAYRVQVQLYAQAIEAATGATCDAMLLGV